MPFIGGVFLGFVLGFGIAAILSAGAAEDARNLEAQYKIVRKNAHRVAQGGLRTWV